MRLPDDSDSAADQRDLPLAADAAPDRATTSDTPLATDLAVKLADSASPLPDAAASDAAIAPEPDGALADQDAKPGADAATVERSNHTSGCSCRLGGHGSGIAGFLVVVLGAAAGRRRQRTPRRPSYSVSGNSRRPACP